MTNAVSEVTPEAAFAALSGASDAVLVDVRTKAEWSFVGVPDLSSLNKQVVLQEWMTLPGMSVSPDFLDGVIAQLGGVSAAPSEIYFLCRSGARSMQAAHAVASAFGAEGKEVSCVNVAEGFEGDLDQESHRGKINGWKARGLPWRQS